MSKGILFLFLLSFFGADAGAMNAGMPGVLDSLQRELDKLPTGDDRARGDLLHRMGNVAWAEDDVPLAIDYTRAALVHRLRDEAERPDPVLVSTFNLGLYHQSLAEFRTALDYYLQVLERVPHRKEGETYFQIGRVYREMGSIASAVLAFEAALKVPPFLADGPTHGLALEELADVHLLKENPEGGAAALPLLREAIRQYGDDDYSVINATAALGRALNLTGHPERAIDELERALQRNAKTLGDDELRAILLTNLGIANRRAGRYERAEDCYRQALAVDLSLAGGQRPDRYVANDYDNLSSLYLYRNQPDSALHYAQLAIEWLIGDFRPADIESLPVLADLGLAGRQELQTYLLDKARAWVALGAAGRAGAYEQALLTFRYADASADQLRRNQLLEDSRTYWRADARTFYREALGAAYAVGDVDAVFYFMEKARARLLLDELSAERAWEELPESARSVLRSAATEVRRSDASSLELQRFQRVQDSIFLLYPDYERAQVGVDPPRLSEIQEGTLVEYFIDSNICLALVVAPGQDPRVIKLADLAEWENALTTYLGELRDPATSVSGDIGLQLYEILIAPLALEGGGHITIVPDGKLYSLPFGTLLTAEPAGKTYAEWPWWSLETDISYAFSVQLLEVARTQRGRGNGRALALAPVARLAAGDPVTSRLELPATAATVRHLAGLLPTDTLINAAASRTAFAERADAYSLLHLGTHAYLSDDSRENSFLLRDPDFPRYDTKDLAEHRFLADLVVIAGCETGVGQELPGEGIASLGRAFARRGAPNLLVSLWSIEDGATASLLNTTYDGLAAGQAPGKSLNAAQRTYLATQTHPDFAHPYYWGGLVYFGVGEGLPLAQRRWGWLLYVGGGVLVVGLCYLILVRLGTF